MKPDRLMARLVLSLVGAQLVLALGSWLLSAAGVDGVRSLISAEGLRWFCGHFVGNLLAPPLVWLLLVAMAAGCLWQSRLPQRLLDRTSPVTFRERTGLWTVLAAAVVALAVVALLAGVPHAVLLSATGRLFPSPFSRFLVPLGALTVILLSACYGLMTDHFRTFADAVGSLSFGIAKAAPLFVVYVLLIHFYDSLIYVFA